MFFFVISKRHNTNRNEQHKLKLPSSKKNNKKVFCSNIFMGSFFLMLNLKLNKNTQHFMYSIYVWYRHVHVHFGGINELLNKRMVSFML